MVLYKIDIAEGNYENVTLLFYKVIFIMLLVL